MANQLTAGTVTDAATQHGSMVAAIEYHLNQLLTTPLPTADTPEARDRRRLFAAIARGVVEHLKENPEALKVIFTHVDGGNIGNYAAHVEVQATDV
jgi:phenylpyruvate tautomerase PptA (4-oxalocrotonate tautomerase family)